jgi:outer membrane protein
MAIWSISWSGCAKVGRVIRIRMVLALAAAALLSMVAAQGARAQEPAPAPTPAAEPTAAATPADATATPANGAQKVVSMAPDPNLPPTNLTVGDNAIQLSLDDALSISLQRNLGLLVQRYTREQFRLGIDEALGIYDLGIVADATTSSDTTPSFSFISGTGRLVTKRRSTGFTLSQLLPWGGVASTGFSLFRQESNNKDIAINPTYTGNLDFGYTQPLLRNLGRIATEYRIRLAQIDDSISREDLEVVVANTLQATENAYWNLAQARKEVEVANEALSLAQDLHHMNEVRVQVGTLAKLELVQSEVGIATRKEAIILAQAAQGNAEDALRQLLHVEEGGMWTLPIVPTTKPDTSAVNIDLAQALDTAVAERPEVKTQSMILDRRATDVAFLHNQTRPRLDLITAYGYNGGNALVERDPATGQLIPVAGGVSDVLDQLRTHDLPGWSVGLQLAYPLQNRQARAAKAIAEVSLDQGKTQMDQLQESVRTEVRRAVRGVTTAFQEIDSASESMRLAEKNLDAERKRYENGLSTSFQVLEIQADLTAARSRLVAAVAAYRRAIAEYYRSTGRLLEADGVELNDPLHVDHLDRFGFGIGEPSGK